MLPLVLLVPACGDSARTGSGTPPPPTTTAAGAPDSMVLRTAGGIEVWFIDGRPARDSSGSSCHEWGLEIRDGADRRGVPLLYTREVPVVLDDTSIAARISNGCSPGDRYRVSLRTGRPVPLGEP